MTSTTGHSTTCSVHVARPPQVVWAQMVHPGARWMLGMNVETDYLAGSQVTFEGHYMGREFADWGTVVEVDRPRLLHFTHFSPSMDLPDVPENYHDIRITLEPDDAGTVVRVEEQNIETAERAARAQALWTKALGTLAGHD
ncbi:SRPBCC family protein [Cellulosimicrobium arenosum]|uniref:SRPBCC domain-containing protein n=1 Tax=Cellulosimicrobium arenosum TaxID=2708133 RepID=A0A927G8G2_9MICO|nr:SRPBCC domain-containing protein [Cellulosimicrobium arenosum]MBD8078590.1 SRPBCC domain-containing protein [Cellulosimicrobium arenosum]